MRGFTVSAIALAIVSLSACNRTGDPLQAAAKAIGGTELNSLEFSGTGRWYQFGQAPNPDSAWPPFEVSRYTATIDYQVPAAHVQQVRKQVVEPGRARPTPVEQKPDQYVSGAVAWNLAPPQGAPAGTAPSAQPQPAAVDERVAEIWSTPQGFIKAAIANKASTKAIEGGSEIAFTVGKLRFVGITDAQHQLLRVQTLIDNPVLGDTPFETTFADYKDFDGVRFPAHITRQLGGYPVLDLQVSEVKANVAADLKVPEDAGKVPPVAVTVETVAPGVLYLRGGSHHSVAIEQQDHIIVVEAPLNEARSEAVIAKVKESIPGKTIRYLINSHAHFDHSGGLRTYVAEGATIVTHAQNEAYYRNAWAKPHSLNPDRLEKSKTAPVFETFKDRHVLTDGKREVVIHPIAASGHNDAFALVYLPAEKILIEADAYNPLPATAPPLTEINPYTANLYENIQRLGLDVQKITALHGPGVVSLTDLQAAVAPKS
ncbi:MAG: MBL fold metallo-hydrolase [Xanthomonadaceae bacterium]|nr:MBL fold metallo-hydrolase [Xanthomonadaceae bacterium]